MRRAKTKSFTTEPQRHGEQQDRWIFSEPLKPSATHILLDFKCVGGTSGSERTESDRSDHFVAGPLQRFESALFELFMQKNEICVVRRYGEDRNPGLGQRREERLQDADGVEVERAF